MHGVLQLFKHSRYNYTPRRRKKETGLLIQMGSKCLLVTRFQTLDPSLLVKALPLDRLGRENGRNYSRSCI
jgi:hypothetical protein